MNILWEPEEGKCTECDSGISNVRRFTTDGRHYMFCRHCWNMMTDYGLGDVDWLKDDHIIVEYEESPQSIEQRQREAEQRKLQAGARRERLGKPSKRQRRDATRLKTGEF